MPRILFILLVAGLCLPLGAATPLAQTAPSEKLYRALSPSPTAQDFELFLAPAPGASSIRDAAVVRVIVKRHGKAAIDGLLLTLSATSLAPRSVSRRQVTLALDAGQREAAADFTVQNPGCGPAKVVAALFKQLEPLARAERTLRFPCADKAD